MKSIRIGNQTSFAAASPLDPLRFAIESGFGAFEWFPDKKPTGAGWALSEMGPSERAEIMRLGREHDIRMSVHAPWQANPLIDEHRDYLSQSLGFAIDTGARLVVLHPFLADGAEAYVEALSPFISSASDAGVRLAIENTVYTCPGDMNTLFSIIRRLTEHDHVVMCFDMGHANLCSATQNDYVGYLEAIDPDVTVGHIHLHENRGDFDTHLPLFTGPSASDDAGVRALVHALLDRGFYGSMIFEQWPEPRDLLIQARHRLAAIIADSSPQVKKKP